MYIESGLITHDEKHKASWGNYSNKDSLERDFNLGSYDEAKSKRKKTAGFTFSQFNKDQQRKQQRKQRNKRNPQGKRNPKKKKEVPQKK